MREGFVFFRSYLSVLLLVEEKHRAELLEAICAYALDGVLLPLSGKSEVAMSAIKPLIDMNERHHARTKKRASEEGESVKTRRKTLPPLVTPQEKEIEIEKEIKKEKEKEQAAPVRAAPLSWRAPVGFQGGKRWGLCSPCVLLRHVERSRPREASICDSKHDTSQRRSKHHLVYTAVTLRHSSG